MYREIDINKMNKSITFQNRGIGFTQLGIAKEILDLIDDLQQENKQLKEESPYLYTNTEWEDILEYQGKPYIELDRYKTIQQENKQLKNILTELEEWLKTFHKNSEFEVWEITRKIQKLKEKYK